MERSLTKVASATATCLSLSAARVAAVAALAWFAATATASAGTHVVVIDPLRPTNDVAQLEVTSSPAQLVTYTVFPNVNGGAGAPVTLTAEPNADHFTTNPTDLFEASGGRLALVIATTQNPAIYSTAVLSQGRLLVSVPDARSVGTACQFPLGDLPNQSTAVLHVASPGAPANVTVRYVSETGPQIDGFALTPNSVRAVTLDRSLTNVVVLATSPVLCQVVIEGRGREADSFIVLPAQ